MTMDSSSSSSREFAELREWSKTVILKDIREPSEEEQRADTPELPKSMWFQDTNSGYWVHCDVSVKHGCISAMLKVDPSQMVFHDVPVGVFHIQPLAETIPERENTFKAIFPADQHK